MKNIIVKKCFFTKCGAMENKKKNIIIIDTSTFPNGFVRKIRKNFKVFKFIILDNFDKKIYIDILKMLMH